MVANKNCTARVTRIGTCQHGIAQLQSLLNTLTCFVSEVDLFDNRITPNSHCRTYRAFTRHNVDLFMNFGGFAREVGNGFLVVYKTDICI